MSSLTIAPSFSSHNIYHVFLSSTHEHTSKNFIDHLYTALVNAGFRTFRNDKSIQTGEEDIYTTSEHLKTAIRQSRSSIIIFSKAYASSTRCLQRLCFVLQCRRKFEHVVLPVFIDVDPSDVRKQTGCFAEAFQRHQKRYTSSEVSQWRAALRETADLAGMVLKNQEDGHESRFIQKIISVIEGRIRQRISILPPYVVGILPRTRILNNWIWDQTSNTSIAAVCGMGGIGKTTIAKFVYNANFKYFDGACFLEEIRETSKRPNGLVQLQKRLLSDFLKRKDEKIWNVDEGIVKIQNALCNKRILLVLDDVDDVDQINAIFGMRNWFYPGSKIIITTRDEHLLRAHKSHVNASGLPNLILENEEVCKVFKVQQLDPDESSMLFNQYAFGQDEPVEDYANESSRIVSNCGGLPLALIVLGRSLHGISSIDVWRSTADKLQAIPNSRVPEKLKISYMCLEDDHDRDLFLYIVFFFVGKDKDRAIQILDELQFFTMVGIENLIDRCVLYVNEQNKLRMHQLLQDLGKDIIRLESTMDLGKRRILWNRKDALNVLMEKSGTKAIEGFILDMNMFDENGSARKPCDCVKGPPVSITENGDDTNRQNFTPTYKIFLENKDPVEVGAFTGMKSLAILHLKHVQLTGSYEKFPNSIRWLSWQEFHHESIPDLFPLEDIVALDLRYSSLKHFWTENKVNGSLKILNLGHSHSLICTPDFSLLPNLERLVLKYCTSLVEIHENIGYLHKLIFLNLEGCKNLEKLPNNIGMLKLLENLNISGCKKIRELSELSKLDSLKVLIADGLSTDQSLFSKGENSYVMLKPRQSPNISWASLPRTLVRLRLSKCSLLDDDFPNDFIQFSSLKDLDLNENLITRLPYFIRHLRLHTLSLSTCRNLQSIEGLPKLRDLSVRECTSLKKIKYQYPIPSIYTSVVFTGCPNLVEVDDWFKIEGLETVDNDLAVGLGLDKLEFPPKKNQVIFTTRYYGIPYASPIQGIHEFGFFSTFVPGEEIPSSFTQRCDGPSVLMSVPALCNLKVQGLNICAIFSHPEMNEENFYPYMSGRLQKARMPDELGPLFLKVTNKTKRVKWIYLPSCIGISMVGTHTMWLCRWKFWEQVQEGDEVCVSIVVDDAFHVVECGVSFVFEEHSVENIVSERSRKIWIHADEDISEYCIKPGVFFLSERPSEFYDWFQAEWAQILVGDFMEDTDIDGSFGEWKDRETCTRAYRISRLRIS